ncbi:S-Ena type endospore appendage [Peribacillus asahii]|uniref:S-Ena type endospore appendage n=1 Tax=Peribacillus asahii TaxID=228899 RepID=UPI0037F51B3A
MDVQSNSHISPPPLGSLSLFPRKSNLPEPQLVADEIGGVIVQNCDGKYVEYWRAIGMASLPSGSLTVKNNCGCTMKVRADTDGDGKADTTLFTLTEMNQTKSVTLKTISNLEISCRGGSGQKANGHYSMKVRYVT